MGFVAAAGYPSKFMELRWVTRREKGKSKLNLKPSKIPIYISTNPSDVNPQALRQLYMSCNHSCHRYRFPKLGQKDGKVEEDEEAVDIDKLCVALSHSCVIVSLFSRLHHLDTDTDNASLADKSLGKQQTVRMWGNLMERVMPVTPSDGQLVGFGRAVSDVGLTAAIYDVMVIPSYRRMGLGRMIVQRIVRMLTSREIYDIAALCSEEERLFFEACGFGDDILGSTTMMYIQRP